MKFTLRDLIWATLVAALLLALAANSISARKQIKELNEDLQRLTSAKTFSHAGQALQEVFRR